MYFIFLVVYILMLIAVGFFSRRKVKGISDFYLGGRSISPWLSAFSYGTAYFSAVVFIGYAGKMGWGFGLSALWIVLGNALVGSFLAWHILGPRTREITKRLNVSTMPEFIEVRYQSKALKIFTAAIIFVFLIPYSASVYKGLGYLFEEVFGFSNVSILLVIACFTGLYLLLGGFVASTIADFIQAITMIIGVIFMLFYVIRHPNVGGFENAIESLRAIDPQLVKPIGPQGLLTTLSLVTLTSLGSWGLPQMVHKFYTIRDEKSIICAKWVSSGFALLITFGAYFTGILSRLFFPDSMPLTNGGPNPDLVVPQVLVQTLPSVVLGIILILVLSASMSTLASLVLASSSAVVLDLIKGVFFPNIKQERLTLLMRIFCLAFVALSFLLAVLPNPVYALMALSWGAVSGSLMAPYILGLYWKKATKTGVWAGIITALGLVIGGALYTGIDSEWTSVFGACAIIVPLIVIPVVSIFTKSYEEEHINRFYNINMKTADLSSKQLALEEMR